RRGELDLEAVEMATRAAMHQAGAAILSRLLSGSEAAPEEVGCGCGGRARWHETRPKQLTTVLGPVRYERAYYRCRRCGRGQSPRDRELEVVGTSYSPGVRRMMGLVGSETSFARGREQLELLAGLRVTTKAVEREAEALGGEIGARERAEIERAKQLELPEVCVPAVEVLYIQMDGTGVPVVKAETEGRAGRDPDEAPRTREVKLGCVFTQTTTDREGRPVRDEASTTYTGAIEMAEEFGLRLYTEAWRRGWERAKKKVLIGDGAAWIWNLAAQHFPGAVQIVDLYHAREHLWELSAKLFADDERRRRRWVGRWLRKLDQGQIEALVKAIRRLPAPDQELARLLANEADYFERHAERMRYPEFRRQGLFVGSGVVEAGCRHLIGARLKRSGMFWTVAGANAILALRCCRLSGRFEDFWESRSSAA
ncbi:MAG TPA: ISKra4 family transposase, partial [Acidobacteria bacterium]|nr:ISKra4 family transposase [Acidobacteriota bacterium]